MAIAFIAVLFLAKNTSIFQKKEIYDALGKETGLSYETVPLKDLINRDTDLDGVLDWEESLWGTDPTKKETTVGVSDSATIQKLKAEQAKTTGETSDTGQDNEKITQTDNFSRELFATVASLAQNGQVDEATIEKLSDSLAERITNPAVKKVFLVSEIKISDGNSPEAIENYLIKLDDLYSKIPKGKSVLDILTEFLGDGENVNVKALSKLDPVIKNLATVISGMVKITTPKNLAPHHLNLINTLQTLKENIADIQFFEADPVIAMGGVVSYQKNLDKLDSVILQLSNEINKLSN